MVFAVIQLVVYVAAGAIMTAVNVELHRRNRKTRRQLRIVQERTAQRTE